jgi:hypothetical protein
MTRVEGAPLTVTLGFVDARMINAHSVRVEWETLSETNCQGFYVQRFRDGTTNFEDAPGGFVAGQGTTSETHRYEYTDTLASTGRWWYRLRTVYFQGNSTYSDSRMVDVPLSVTLGMFDAWMINGHTVRLEWETVSEIHNYGFYVQRLRDGATDYENVPGGFVAGHGTTIETHRYEFTDTTASLGRWWYRLRMVDLQGVSTYSDAHLVDILTTVDHPQTPGDFQLMQNYPNPFNPSTRIEFALPVRSHVVVSVYNVLGESIGGLIDAELPSGVHSVEFDATNLPGGVYFYRLRAAPSVSGQDGTFTETKKLVLTR